jgi:hypothetical protein
MIIDALSFTTILYIVLLASEGLRRRDHRQDEGKLGIEG